MSNKLQRPTATVIACDAEGSSSVPDEGFFQVVTQPSFEIIEHSRQVFVLTAASRLGDVARLVTAANREHKLRALFVRTDVDPRLLPQIFEHAGLRTMRNTIAHYGPDIPLRVLRAWEIGAQRDLIADASVIGDTLQVVSCEPQSYRIPFSAVTALREMPIADRSNLEVASDGSYVHWPTHDIHMDLASLLTAIGARHKAERVKHAYGHSYGMAIAHFRKKHGLRQTDIGGLSEREVRRIEAEGEGSLDSLRKLAAAHELELSTYLDRIATLAQGFGGALAQETDGEQVSDTGT